MKVCLRRWKCNPLKFRDPLRDTSACLSEHAGTYKTSVLEPANEVDDLNKKVHQLTNFIKDRGLLEAFIAPKAVAVKEKLQEKKQHSAERDKIRREVISEKKVKHSQAR